jgi:hypothetical protein
VLQSKHRRTGIEKAPSKNDLVLTKPLLAGLAIGRVLVTAQYF